MKQLCLRATSAQRISEMKLETEHWHSEAQVYGWITSLSYVMRI